jgi:hypothetical protein
MIVRVSKQNGFELYDCTKLIMQVTGTKNNPGGIVDLVEFRLFDNKEELVTLEIDEKSQVYVMNNDGQTITKYYS